jgi:hypothetical protein
MLNGTSEEAGGVPPAASPDALPLLRLGALEEAGVSARPLGDAGGGVADAPGVVAEGDALGAAAATAAVLAAAAFAASSFPACTAAWCAKTASVCRKSWCSRSVMRHTCRRPPPTSVSSALSSERDARVQR